MEITEQYFTEYSFASQAYVYNVLSDSYGYVWEAIVLYRPTEKQLGKHLNTP